MDIYRICRTCLNESHTNLVSIHSAVDPNNDDNLMKPEKDENYTEIANILDDLTEHKYNSDVYPYPNKICRLCLNNLKNAYEFKQRCVNAFEKLMKLSDFNSVYPEEYVEVKPFMQVDVDVLIDDNVLSEENDTHFGGYDGHFNEDESNEPIEPLEKKKKNRKTKKNPSPTKKKASKPSQGNDQIRPYNCTECDKSFARSTHLKRHMTIHSDERPFACSECDKRFRRSDHLKKHESQHLKIKPHKCEQCQRTFSRVELLRSHISNRHTSNATAFECIECKFVCETMRELKRHRKSHNEHDTVKKCRTCDETFATKSELTEHTKSHNDEQKHFLCTECGMRFIRNDYLVVHMRRHTGDKPYKCRFCSRAFPRNTDLTVHERYHTNDKRHICDDCGKGFQRAYNLTVHKRTHTGEKPYECEYCSRRFAQCNDLKSHIRRHTGERFACDICGAQFIQIYLLNNHKKDAHGINTKPQVSRLTKFEPLTESANVVLPIEFSQQNEKVSTDYCKNES